MDLQAHHASSLWLQLAIQQQAIVKQYIYYAIKDKNLTFSLEIAQFDFMDTISLFALTELSSFNSDNEYLNVNVNANFIQYVFELKIYVLVINANAC